MLAEALGVERSGAGCVVDKRPGPARVERLADQLAALDVPAEWHISPGVGHGIDPVGLRLGVEFLTRAFAP